jgi:hypothetical protein
MNNAEFYRTTIHSVLRSWNNEQKHKGKQEWNYQLSKQQEYETKTYIQYHLYSIKGMKVDELKERLVSRFKMPVKCNRIKTLDNSETFVIIQIEKKLLYPYESYRKVICLVMCILLGFAMHKIYTIKQS